MPLFAVICRDKPDSLQIRLANRESHLAHIRDSGVVFMAGPLLEDDEMRGSLVILDVPDLGAAEAWADKDPYRQAGLFSGVQVIEWKKVIG